jgi:hypothetical protein
MPRRPASPFPAPPGTAADRQADGRDPAWWPLYVTGGDATAGYTGYECWRITSTVEKQGGRVLAEANPGFPLVPGTTFAAGDYALVRSAPGAGGLQFEMIPAGRTAADAAAALADAAAALADCLRPFAGRTAADCLRARVLAGTGRCSGVAAQDWFALTGADGAGTPARPVWTSAADAVTTDAGTGELEVYENADGDTRAKITVGTDVVPLKYIGCVAGRPQFAGGRSLCDGEPVGTCGDDVFVVEIECTVCPGDEVLSPCTTDPVPAGLTLCVGTTGGFPAALDGLEIPMTWHAGANYSGATTGYWHGEVPHPTCEGVYIAAWMYTNPDCEWIIGLQGWNSSRPPFSGGPLHSSPPAAASASEGPFVATVTATLGPGESHIYDWCNSSTNGSMTLTVSEDGCGGPEECGLYHTTSPTVYPGETLGTAIPATTDFVAVAAYGVGGGNSTQTAQMDLAYDANNRVGLAIQQDGAYLAYKVVGGSYSPSTGTTASGTSAMSITRTGDSWEFKVAGTTVHTTTAAIGDVQAVSGDSYTAVPFATTAATITDVCITEEA